MHLIEELFSNYGYLVLLAGLFLELIALPIPGEIIMSYCGFLVFRGNLNWGLSILFASSGVIAGITVAYMIGSKLGHPFFMKYGKYMHLGPERLEKMSVWFNSFGKHVIFLTYYIPGVRHFSGYLAGITRLSFKSFSLNAYLGAVVWTAVFISLGRALGSQWDRFHAYTREFGIIGGIILLIIVVVYYAVRYYKKQIVNGVLGMLNLLFNIFHSMGRIKVLVSIIFLAFLGLVAGMVGLIHDFFEKEYVKFDEVAQFIVSKAYTEDWHGFMKFFAESTSILAVIVVCTVCTFLILEKNFDRFLEIRFMLLTVAGGEVFARLLQMAFQRSRPVAYAGAEFIRNLHNSYPSVEVMMAVIAYGFLAFLVVRHKNGIAARISAITVFLLAVVFSGQSVLYFGAQHPSDVLAGYVFGGVWLSINLITMEIFRILPRLTKHKYI